MRQSLSITLLDGRKITCYENKSQERSISEQHQLDTAGMYLRTGRSLCSPQPKSAKPEAPPTEVNTEAQRELFHTYFHAFYSHRERILSDSRMFLTPIPMHNGLAFTGGVEFPTLGVLIEWLLHAPNATEQDADGRIWMVCRFAGSPLSGSNQCTLVDAEGNTRTQSLYPFISLWTPFLHINHRYADAKDRDQHYTLEEVVEIFSKEGLLQPDPNEITILHLSNLTARLKQQIQEANKCDRKRNTDFHQALMKRHFNQLCPMVTALEQQLSCREQRLPEIYTLRADLRNRLRNQELSPRDYQQQLAPLNREREEILRFCREQSTAHICAALFEGEYIPLAEMQHFISHYSPTTERSWRLSHWRKSVRRYLIRRLE